LGVLLKAKTAEISYINQTKYTGITQRISWRVLGFASSWCTYPAPWIL